MSELPHQGFLFATAEVAAAFVGFSLVVSLFGARSSSEVFRAAALRDVAEISLVGVAGSLAPYVVFQFHASMDGLWRLCSLLLACAWILGFVFGSRRLSRVGDSPANLAPGIARVVGPVALTGVGLLFWNVVSPGSFSDARYLLALLLLLTMAGCFFVFAAFHGSEKRLP